MLRDIHASYALQVARHNVESRMTSSTYIEDLDVHRIRQDAGSNLLAAQSKGVVSGQGRGQRSPCDPKTVTQQARLEHNSLSDTFWKTMEARAESSAVASVTSGSH